MRSTNYGIVTLLLVSCSESKPASDYLVRDSAGIRIVESRRPVDPAHLTIAGPILDIGGQADGNPNVEFIGPVSAVRLKSGRIIAAGWAATELREFDSAGTWLRNIGQRGSGPGEFEALGHVYEAPNDRLITYEPRSRRIQWFDSSGSFMKFTVLAASPDEGYPTVVGTLRGEDLLVQTSSALDSGKGGPLIPNRHRYYRFTSSSGRFTLLLETSGPTYIRHPANSQLRIGILPFAHEQLVAIGREGLLSFGSSGFNVDVLDSTGVVRRRFRRAFNPEMLTATTRADAAKAATADWEPALAAAVRPIITSASVPSHRPAGWSMVISPKGLVFVQHFGTPRQPARQISVFDSAGVWLQQLELPAVMTLRQAGSDFLLGTFPDSAGFYHIAVVRLSNAR